jgi:O-antigen ligase
MGGIYSNPNDLAFAIVLAMPFCLAFLLDTPRVVVKAAWCVGMCAMAVALLLTASRAGFLDMVITGAVCLWHLGVKGRRHYLIAIAGLLAIVIIVGAGGKLKERFVAMGDSPTVETKSGESAAESYEERKTLIMKSLAAIAEYPILGLGAQNFIVYSDLWRQVHVSYLQIAADAGIPVLILYLMFFYRGFANLRYLKKQELDPQMELYRGALHASLIGFVVGAAFAPQAYLYFPYLTVLYTSVLAAMVREKEHEVSAINLSPATRRLRLYRGKTVVPAT